MREWPIKLRQNIALKPALDQFRRVRRFSHSASIALEAIGEYLTAVSNIAARVSISFLRYLSCDWIKRWWEQVFLMSRIDQSREHTDSANESLPSKGGQRGFLFDRLYLQRMILVIVWSAEKLVGEDISRRVGRILSYPRKSNKK